MSQTNVQLVRSGWEAASRGDYDTIGALLDPDVRWHGGDPDFEGACRSRAQALRFMRGRAVPELVDVIDAGEEQVVVVVRPPGGELRANLTRLRDGRVVEMIAFETPEQALAAARGTSEGPRAGR